MLDLPPVLATENVVFVTGAFRRTMTVSSLDQFVETGVPKGLLADLLRFTGSQPKPCLLYTSPSPRDYAASRMPSSA